MRGADAALLAERYRGGATVADMAARRGVTPKAVEMRLRRARQAFLARFREVGRDWLRADDRPAGGEGRHA